MWYRNKGLFTEFRAEASSLRSEMRHHALPLRRLLLDLRHHDRFSGLGDGPKMGRLLESSKNEGSNIFSRKSIAVDETNYVAGGSEVDHGVDDEGTHG